jgi:hypothetical protein
MNLKVPTLEEVFLRLTGEGTRQYGGRMTKDEKKKMKAKRNQPKTVVVSGEEEVRDAGNL